MFSFDNVYLNSSLVDKFGETLSDNLVEFSVYYDSLAYASVEESPKITFVELIGTLGGHLHLFLGMSLLSFLELVDIAIQIVVFLLRMPKTNVVFVKELTPTIKKV